MREWREPVDSSVICIHILHIWGVRSFGSLYIQSSHQVKSYAYTQHLFSALLAIYYFTTPFSVISSLLHILIHPYTHIHIIMGGQTFLGHFSPLLILFSHFYIHTDIHVQTLVRTGTYLITTIYTFSHFLVFYPTFIFVLTHTHIQHYGRDISLLLPIMP